MKVKSWIKTIETHIAAIAKERDKLDEAISEMEGLRCKGGRDTRYRQMLIITEVYHA